MAIPWLIGAAVVGVVGAVLSSDDNSSSSVEKERARAKRERERNIERVEKEEQERKRTTQNNTEAERFINKYALNISASDLVELAESEALEPHIIELFYATPKFKKRAKQIELLSKRYKELQKIERELTTL